MSVFLFLAALGAWCAYVGQGVVLVEYAINEPAFVY